MVEEGHFSRTLVRLNIKLCPPFPSKHYSHSLLKRSVYLLSGVTYIYLVEIDYLTDFSIQPGKKISYIHLLRENAKERTKKYDLFINIS